MPWRVRVARMFLWVSVVAWGLLVGGKLFDLRVLVGAWSASPPESLNLLPPVMLLVTLVFTVLWFWPANAALWAVARGAPNAIGDPAEIAELVRRWVTYDWLRVAVGLVGFVCSIRAISVPFPAPPVSRG